MKLIPYQEEIVALSLDERIEYYKKIQKIKEDKVYRALNYFILTVNAVAIMAIMILIIIKLAS